jgi:DNA-binding CsgD family transcriptional regulator
MLRDKVTALYAKKVPNAKIAKRLGVSLSYVEKLIPKDLIQERSKQNAKRTTTAKRMFRSKKYTCSAVARKLGLSESQARNIRNSIGVESIVRDKWFDYEGRKAEVVRLQKKFDHPADVARAMGVSERIMGIAFRRYGLKYNRRYNTSYNERLLDTYLEKAHPNLKRGVKVCKDRRLTMDWKIDGVFVEYAGSIHFSSPGSSVWLQKQKNDSVKKATIEGYQLWIEDRENAPLSKQDVKRLRKAITSKIETLLTTKPRRKLWTLDLQRFLMKQ